MTDEVIEQQIVNRLSRDSRIAPAQIKVDVAGGHVTLSGSVPSLSLSKKVDEATRTVPCVRSVENELEIQSAPANKAPQDEELEHTIETLLHWNAELDDSEIMVFVAEGLVIIEGSVDTYWEKKRAEDLAATIKGVLGINNKLAVIPYDKIPDELIADEIMTALGRDPALDAKKLDLVVVDGIVTLSGSVSNRMERGKVHDAATHTQGVKEIEDRLTIDDDDERCIAVKWLRQKRPEVIF